MVRSHKNSCRNAANGTATSRVVLSCDYAVNGTSVAAVAASSVQQCWVSPQPYWILVLSACVTRLLTSAVCGTMCSSRRRRGRKTLLPQRSPTTASSDDDGGSDGNDDDDDDNDEDIRPGSMSVKAVAAMVVQAVVRAAWAWWTLWMHVAAMVKHVTPLHLSSWRQYECFALFVANSSLFMNCYAAGTLLEHCKKAVPSLRGHRGMRLLDVLVSVPLWPYLVVVLTHVAVRALCVMRLRCMSSLFTVSLFTVSPSLSVSVSVSVILSLSLSLYVCIAHHQPAAFVFIPLAVLAYVVTLVAFLLTSAPLLLCGCEKAGTTKYAMVNMTLLWGVTVPMLGTMIFHLYNGASWSESVVQDYDVSYTKRDGMQ